MPFKEEKFEEIRQTEEEKKEIEERAEVEVEKEIETEIMEIEKVKMGIDRELSKEKEQEINELKERNKERFEKLNFDLENLELYIGDIYPMKGECKSFFEIAIIDKHILFSSEDQKNFIVSHEIGHYLINQKLPQEFFKRHPELREKKRNLFKNWLDKRERIPPLMEDEFIEKIKNKYWIGKKEELTVDRATEILEKFTEDFQRFKPESVKSELFEKLSRYSMGETFLLNFKKEKPFKNEGEYEKQAIIVLGQLGELLTKKVNETEAEKYNIGLLERKFIEEGASNYLAAKLLDIPLDKFPYRGIDGVEVAQELDRKLKGKIEPLVKIIKENKSLVEFYKAKNVKR
jgi:hypothetical protein